MEGDERDDWVSIGGAARMVLADVSARRAGQNGNTARAKERRRQRRRRLHPRQASAGRWPSPPRAIRKEP